MTEPKIRVEGKNHTFTGMVCYINGGVAVFSALLARRSVLRKVYSLHEERSVEDLARLPKSKKSKHTRAIWHASVCLKTPPAYSMYSMYSTVSHSQKEPMDTLPLHRIKGEGDLNTLFHIRLSVSSRNLVLC